MRNFYPRDKISLYYFPNINIDFIHYFAYPIFNAVILKTLFVNAMENESCFPDT